MMPPYLRRSVIGACVVLVYASTNLGGAAEPVSRWKLAPDGGIVWNLTAGDIHEDFIEMSGEQVGLLIRYGINQQGIFSVNRELIWPMLRFHPNLTGSHLRMSFGEDARIDADLRFSAGIIPAMSERVDDEWQPITNRTLHQVHHDGIARFEGTLGVDSSEPKLAFRREIFPSIDKPAAIDTTVISNVSTSNVELAVDDFQQTSKTSPERGVYGAYTITERVLGAGIYTLRPGDSATVTVVFEAHKDNEPLLNLDVGAEESARTQRVEEILGELVLKTPDPLLNTAYAFAKLHTTESLFRTKGGLVHSPGGGMAYYAAIWANDQAEYANPFFGMLGDQFATTAAINSFRLFAHFINREYYQIPSSIISEGDGFWSGAGDRGDMAMIAYGATRFALANGERQTAEELWPLIEWCLEYLRRKVTPQGVVASDSDELEGRLPAGKANLNTSSLYYDALRSATMLGHALGKQKTQLDGYSRRAAAVKKAIDQYFGADVAGFKTYRYYNKADVATSSWPEVARYATQPDALRAWIATPLAMGILDRRSGTINALFSAQLWTADGLASEAGQRTYWDRSTLYALRGVLAAGATQRGMQYLGDYSNRRLLGDHVPYPFEAYPEGGKAQLAAEGALYCRIFTEGLFGIRPTGLRSFNLTARLPEGWASMTLEHVHAFGNMFDLNVMRAGASKVEIAIAARGRPKRIYTVKSGDTASIKLGD